jgi:hypothetical protein
LNFCFNSNYPPLAEGIGLDLEEDSEEFRQLCERTRILTSYFGAATEKMKETLKSSQPHVLPLLQEAFSLQIPTELRQKIVSSSQSDQHYIGLGELAAGFFFSTVHNLSSGISKTVHCFCDPFLIE